jgi:hypothetical protein
VIERLFGSKLQHDHSSISDPMGVRFGIGYVAKPIA